MDLTRYRGIVDDWEAFVAAAERPEPVVVRARVGRIEPEALAERLRARGFRVTSLPGLPEFLRVDGGGRPVSATLEHWLGLCYVQQASTGLAAPLLDPRPGERVLDLCAAPGGKTTHLAQLMRDDGALVACEINESRIRGLLGNVYRLGHTHVFAVAADGRALPEGARFHRALVDAPCSGEGTLRRRAGRIPRQSKSFRGYVTRAQRDLLAKAVRVTRPGGRILYVTCTFAPEENEAVVDEALRTLPVDLVPLKLDVPHAPGLTRWESSRFDPRLEGAVRIYPHHLDSGGLFLALLTRLEGDAPAPGPDEGWSPVPAAFPEDGEGDAAAAEDVSELVEEARRELIERFGVPPEVLAGVRWLGRGGRLWVHTLDGWPLPGWQGEEGWRPVSVGFRAVEFDGRGRVRPTNDLLQWLNGAVRHRTVELDRERLRVLLQAEALPGEVPDLLGPVALRVEGHVVGRGAATGAGLRSEIPKARAADLLRVLDASPDPP